MSKLLLATLVIVALCGYIGGVEAIECNAALEAVERTVAALPIDAVTNKATDGDPVAENELGRRLGLGLGITKDSGAAFSWYEKAAQHGNCSAQANLAFMYLNGEGVQKNVPAARNWYLKAAEQGDRRAMYALGFMYATGALGAKDGPEAERWFLAAAKRGYVPAQRALVTLYEKGELVPQNLAEAAVWLHRVRDASLGKPWKAE